MKPAKSRRCERPGCNRKQGWQEINGIRVYSLYCGDHTCRVRRSNDPRLQLHFCLQPCKKNLRFCEKHMTCGKKDCHRKNYDKSNEMLATIPWFCHEHAAATSLKTSCVTKTCSSPTQEQRPASKSPQDEKPSPSTASASDGSSSRCSPPSTNSRAQKNHPTLYEMLCPPSCPPSVCVLDSCSRTTATAGELLCDVHECRHPGCHLGSRRDSGFCTLHTCRDPSCNEPTGENRYCGKHACRLAGCPAAAMLPDSRYCFVNKHACFRKRCPEPAITPGGPCKGHGCKKSGCTATSKLSYGGYCMTNGHACVKPNCGKSKVGVIDGIDVELCADHFYDDSLKIAIEVSKLEAERRKEQRHELLCREEKWHQQQKREQQKREQENRKQKQHVDRKREQHTREQEQLEQQRRKQAVPRGETLGAEQPRRSCPEMAELPSYESLFPFRR